jgi:hypothetical protein
LFKSNHPANRKIDKGIDIVLLLMLALSYNNPSKIVKLIQTLKTTLERMQYTRLLCEEQN